MLHMRFQRVREDQVERLRAWMAELARRDDEVQATFAQEGVRAELAYLLHTAAGPILAYAIDIDDWERGLAAFNASTLAIDHEHAAVMRAIDAGPLEVERIWDRAAR